MSLSEPKPGQRPLAAALSLLLALSGCAQMNSTMGVVQQTTVNYYPKCYEPVGYLRESDQRMQQAVGTGVALGALGGAAIGAIATGDSRGAIAGAVLGGLAGGATAYYQQKQQQLAEDSARFAAYGTDIDRATGEYNRTTSAARNAQGCYQKEFQTLVQLRKTRRISDTEGRARFNEIVSGISEANALMAAVDQRIGESLNTYTQAYEEDLKKTGVERQAVTRAARSSKPVAVAGSAKPASTEAAVNTERKVQQASTARDESKAVSSGLTAQLKSFCSNPDVGDWGSGASACGRGV
ncbi:MAG TPA: type VI secretion system-associated lipoprotein TagQ [Plasticicumulans sp.]|nr:type VI secretion system-associated lipoprotein TagQ [Plasticicumulans sp.]